MEEKKSRIDTADILEFRKKAIKSSQRVKTLSSDLCSEETTLKQIVEEYNAKIAELLKKEINKQGLSWCTLCSDKLLSGLPELMPESDMNLILTEGREEYSGGYENSCYGFQNFSKLHRVCPACREILYDRHGRVGAYDTMAKDQTRFYAFRVEKRDDGYYARKFGDWIKIENCKFSELSSWLVERMAKEWGLPPKIELDKDGNLIIHEQPVAAKVA